MFHFFGTACDSLSSNSDTKIVGGKNASQSYNFFATISDGRFSPMCGGSFIEENIVVTAAHCVDNLGTNLYVARGLASMSDASNFENWQKVASIIVHPNYDPLNMENDIALLFINRNSDANDLSSQSVGNPLKGQNVINIERLQSPKKDELLTAIGFGNATSVGDLRFDELQEVNLSVLSSEQCKLANPNLKETGSQICAGDLTSGLVDSCQGDSGGPLFGVDKNGNFILKGIVSYGEACAQKNSPGFYTDVFYYRKWIDLEIKNQEKKLQVIRKSSLVEIIENQCFNSNLHDTFEFDDERFLAQTLFLQVSDPQTISASSYGLHKDLNVVNQCVVDYSKEKQIVVNYIADENLNFEAYIKVGKSSHYKAKVTASGNTKLDCLNLETYATPNLIQLNSEHGSMKGTLLKAQISSDKLEPLDLTRSIQSSSAHPDAALDRAVLKQSCEFKGFSTELYLSEDQKWIVQHNSPTNQSIYGLESFDPDYSSLTARISELASDSGKLEIVNKSETDMLVSWKLSCIFKFTLENSKTAQKFISSEIDPTTGASSVLVAASNFPADGVVKPNQTASYTILIEEFDADQISPTSCALNDIPIEVIHHEP